MIKHLTLFITLIGLFCIQTINSETKCPNGKPITKASCAYEDDCPAGSTCYHRLTNEKYSEVKDNYCCESVLCPTKMIAQHSMNGQWGYLWEPCYEKYCPNYRPKYYYNVKLGPDTIVCPIPYSYIYNQKWEIEGVPVPVDFDMNNMATSQPKTCRKNWECNMANDEYCGVSNHAGVYFSPDMSLPNGGGPLRFCYKFYNSGVKNVRPLLKADMHEMILCYSDETCSQNHGNETFCFMSPTVTEMEVVHDNISVWPISDKARGICAFTFNLQSERFWIYWTLIGSVLFFLFLSE